MEAQHRDDDEDQIGRQDDEIAMGKVHQPHDPEDEAETRGEKRIEPAQKDALHDGVDPDHAAAPK